MSRYSNWSSSRDGLSPFASQEGDIAPRVTEDDFSYITSEDLEHSLQSPPRSYDPLSRQPPPSADPEDDVLLIKNKGITYPVRFPAYTIGDGKLRVRDVRDRVGLVMQISPGRRRLIKMLYKGKHLKDSDAPIREYGVKNNSEVMVVLPEGMMSDDESGESSEEIVVADPRDGQPRKSKNKNKKKKKKNNRSPGESAQNLELPHGAGINGTRRSSAEESGHPSRVPSPAAQNGALEKLQSIRSLFNTKFLPLCVEFTANPPKDKKKCEDEHRKLSETIMQQVLLKLDEVETGGDPDIRSKRKQLVNEVQNVLRGIDELLPEGVAKPTY